MNLFQKLRAFADYIRTEFTLVGEEKLVTRTASAGGVGSMPIPDTAPHAATAMNALPQKSSAFVPAATLEQLPKMTRAKLDTLEFGCVKVSDDGMIQMYNKYQANFAGVDQQSAIGRNFFRELAPCTNNRLIFGRFKDGVKAGELNTIVTYAFTYKMRPTLVRVHLYRDPATSTNWVLVQKHENTQGK